MPTKLSRNHFIDFEDWSAESIQQFLLSVDEIQHSTHQAHTGATAALLFFEPSTRTRMSFETAMWREGLGPLLLDSVSGTSLEKGETVEDTILNVAAMKPELLVIRASDSLDFKAVAAEVSCPVICAGWGKKSHPSQALLDLFTLRQKFGHLESLRLLLVGDVVHSRVVSSLLSLAPMVKLDIALAGPSEFMPTETSYKRFDSLEEGLEWSQASMFLRVQFERHASEINKESYLKNYAWKDDLHMKFLDAGRVLMHPGPVNYGIELTPKAARHSQSLILKQVENGVLVRRALLRWARSQK